MNIVNKNVLDCNIILYLVHGKSICFVHLVLLLISMPCFLFKYGHCDRSFSWCRLSRLANLCTSSNAGCHSKILLCGLNLNHRQEGSQSNDKSFRGSFLGSIDSFILLELCFTVDLIICFQYTIQLSIQAPILKLKLELAHNRRLNRHDPNLSNLHRTKRRRSNHCSSHLFHLVKY